jgi:hypothetical protein
MAQGHGLLALVVGLRHLEGLIEWTLHLRLEPSLDGRVDEVRGDDEDENAGVRARERKARTSLVLKRAPSTFCRRSKASLTRLRKRRTTRRRNTIRFRLKRAKTARFEASGTWGEWIQTLKPHHASPRRASPPETMSRLRR